MFKKYEKKIGVLLVLLVAGILVISGCNNQQPKAGDNKLTVAVAIVPLQGMVEEIAGDLVDVVTVIPEGASPANYQPKPIDMEKVSNAKLYFSVGVPTEAGNILPFVNQIETLQVVNLAEIVDAKYPARYFDAEHHHHHDEDGEQHEDEHHHEDSEQHEDEHHHEDEHEGHSHNGRDPHIWMSPRRMAVIAETVANQLAQVDPDNKAVYLENGAKLVTKIKGMDSDLEDNFSNSSNKKFIIMHPSLGYFADDYGLEMVSIEQNGKQSSSEHLKEVIDYANANGIKVVFYQSEFDPSQSKTIAQEIGGEAIKLNVLAKDYMTSWEEIKKMFEQHLR